MDKNGESALHVFLWHKNKIKCGRQIWEEAQLSVLKEETSSSSSVWMCVCFEHMEEYVISISSDFTPSSSCVCDCLHESCLSDTPSLWVMIPAGGLLCSDGHGGGGVWDGEKGGSKGRQQRVSTRVETPQWDDVMFDMVVPWCVSLKAESLPINWKASC